MTKKITRQAGGVLDAPEWAIEFLLHGESKSNRWAKMSNTEPDFFNDAAATNAREIWETYRDDLIGTYVEQHPGRRPWGFWRFEAPAEHRLRLGGKGDCIPDHVSDEVEEYWRGLPTYWIGEDRLMAWPELAAYAIDPGDPPRFESEAAYLKRLGLLLPGEAERLTTADFEPELIIGD
jgi:hypothetical protein